MLMALAPASLTLSGCIEQDPKERRLQQARGRDELLIGLAWPLQHPKRILRNGVELAIDEINAAGGVLGRRLRLKVADDERSVERGMVIAEQFANEPAMVAVLAHLDTYIATQVAPTYMFNGMLMLSPGAMGLDLTRKGFDKVFRTYPSEEVVATALANHATEAGYGRVAAYYSNDSSGHDLVHAFETQARERGMTVVDRRSYNLLGTDHRLVFDEWRTMHSFDAIFLAGTLPTGAEIIRLMRQAGLKQPILGNTGLDGDEVVTLAADSANGLVVPTVFQAQQTLTEITERFIRTYRKRYKTVPRSPAAVGYDTIHLLAEAMRQARSAEPQRVAAALRDMKPWAGVTGLFDFDENGELKPRSMVLKKVRQEAWTFLGIIDDNRCRLHRSSDGLIKRCGY